jgi:hypothetical protein
MSVFKKSVEQTHVEQKRVGGASSAGKTTPSMLKSANAVIQKGSLYDTVVVTYKGKVVTNPITYKSKNGDCSIAFNFAKGGIEATIMSFTCEVTVDGAKESRGRGAGKKLLLDVLKDIRKRTSEGGRGISFLSLQVVPCGKEGGIILNNDTTLTAYYETLGFQQDDNICGRMWAPLDNILVKNGVKIGGKRRTRKAKKKKSILKKVKKRRVKTKRKRKRGNTRRK